MSEGPKAVVERAVELFNRDFGRGKSEIGADVRAVWAPEPVIVPFRALLEGTEYSGETALEDFVSASLESWSRIWFESEEIRQLDAERVLMLADLVGIGRETGLQMRRRVAMLYAVRGGRIAEVRTHASEQDALAAASS